MQQSPALMNASPGKQCPPYKHLVTGKGHRELSGQQKGSVFPELNDGDINT